MVHVQESASFPFPSLRRSLAHPCAADRTACCGMPRADFVLRFESFLYAPQATLLLAYEAWPICGDGLGLELRLTHAGAHGSATGIYFCRTAAELSSSVHRAQDE